MMSITESVREHLYSKIMVSSRHSMDDLYEKLQPIAEGFIFTDSVTPFAARIIDDGVLHPMEASFTFGTPRLCHQNSLLRWHASEGECRFATGFAYDDVTKMWYHHSWVIHKGRILETTPVERTIYWGIDLTDDECKSYLKAVMGNDRDMYRKLRGLVG